MGFATYQWPWPNFYGFDGISTGFDHISATTQWLPPKIHGLDPVTTVFFDKQPCPLTKQSCPLTQTTVSFDHIAASYNRTVASFDHITMSFDHTIVSFDKQLHPSMEPLRPLMEPLHPLMEPPCPSMEPPHPSKGFYSVQILTLLPPQCNSPMVTCTLLTGACTFLYSCSSILALLLTSALSPYWHSHSFHQFALSLFSTVASHNSAVSLFSTVAFSIILHCSLLAQ